MQWILWIGKKAISSPNNIQGHNICLSGSMLPLNGRRQGCGRQRFFGTKWKTRSSYVSTALCLPEHPQHRYQVLRPFIVEGVVGFFSAIVCFHCGSTIIGHAREARFFRWSNVVIVWVVNNVQCRFSSHFFKSNWSVVLLLFYPRTVYNGIDEFEMGTLGHFKAVKRKNTPAVFYDVLPTSNNNSTKRF